MISILIPVYNYNCITLVKDLHNQCIEANIPFEIIVLDDTSAQYKEENSAINNLENCQFIIAEKHLGRAKIRNKLADLAHGDYLLFIDADASVATTDFIKKYCTASLQADVVDGGVTYREHPPKENALRWYYGTKRECKKAIERNKHPYQSIASFNILIKKSLFHKIEFDETIIDTEKGAYGHEDTLLGLQLKEKNIPILHIDNFLIHNYGETDEIFLRNSLIAVEKYVTHPTFQKLNVVKNIKIFRVFNICKKYRLTGVLTIFYKLFNRIIKKHLFRPNPSLSLFDLYRLSYLAHFYKKNKD